MSVVIKTDFWSYYRGADLEELLEEVKGVKLSPDLADLQIAGEPVLEVLRRHKGELAFPKLTDTRFVDNFENYGKINAATPIMGPQRVYCDLGDGIVDIPEAIEVLEQGGYDGWVICEQRRTLDVYKGLLKMRWYIGHELGTA